MIEQEKAKERHLLRFNNVIIEDRSSGLRLKGVFIRPQIAGESSRERKYYHFVQGSFYIMTAQETAEGERMDAFINQEELARVLVGEELNVKSHLNKSIDVEYGFFRPLEDVFSTSGGKFLPPGPPPPFEELQKTAS